MLKIKELSFSYKDGAVLKEVLTNINYEFKKGVFYTILGESGSGKTTLLSLLSGLDSANEGEILLDQENIEDYGLHKYRKNKIGIVFQSFHLIPYLTGLQNVLLAMSITDNMVSSTDDTLIKLNSLGIDKEKASRPINNLSGGEQQRIAIARALSTNVDIILADEPTGNLDHKTQKEIIKIFKDLATLNNKCVIVVTHSLAVAKNSDVILEMKDGHLNQRK